MNDTNEHEYVLVLRTCAADMTSHNGFVWPESGPVECPDWDPEPVCGGGLHGWLWGEGNGELGDWSEGAKWLVVRVRATDVVDLGGKVKFPRPEVVCCGDRAEATGYLHRNGGAGKAIIGLVMTGWDGSTLAGGYGSTLTGGDWSTLTGGDWSTLTGGYRSTLTGGRSSTLTFSWSDGHRKRIAVAYPGEGGIEPNKPYKCVDGKVVPAE